MKLFKFGVLSVILFTGFLACSSAESTLTETVSEVSSMYPTWYQVSEIVEDSLSYSGFATAIASDSVKSIERANAQARIHLEKRIAQLTEEIRLDLEKSGSSSVKNPDFIIILRTAHAAVQEEATLSEASGKKIDTHYRGFSSVTISKAKLRTVLEQGFKGHPRYWGEFSGAPSFQKYF